MKPVQVEAVSDLRLVEFLSNEHYVSTLQKLQRDRKQRASESSPAASACSLFDVDVAAAEPITKRSTRTTQRSRRRQKKPRESSFASTWGSEDADSDSGWWEEFWNSDSD